MTDKPEMRPGTTYVCAVPAGWTLRQVNGTLYGFAPDMRPHVLTCHVEVGKMSMRWEWEPVEMGETP